MHAAGEVTLSFVYLQMFSAKHVKVSSSFLVFFPMRSLQTTVKIRLSATGGY